MVGMWVGLGGAASRRRAEWGQAFRKPIEGQLSEVTRVAAAFEALILTISDNGPPFDPFARAAPDTTLSIEERQIGGLGIHLVRQMMDEVSYERREGRNVTILTKRISDRTPQGTSGEK